MMIKKSIFTNKKKEEKPISDLKKTDMDKIEKEIELTIEKEMSILMKKYK